MVPLADVFNHKASVVHLDGSFAIAELEDMSAEEGSAASSQGAEEAPDADGDLQGGHCCGETNCAHTDAALSRKRKREAADGAEIAESAGEEGDAALSAYYAAFPDCNLRLEMAICDDVVPCEGAEPQEVLRIIAAQDLGSGCEVHNTYGEHGNDALLFKYGFALPHNPFHSVRITASELAAALAPHLAGQSAHMRALEACMQASVAEPDEWQLPALGGAQSDVSPLAEWLGRWLATAFAEEPEGTSEEDSSGDEDDAEAKEDAATSAIADLRMHGAGFVGGAFACALLALGGTSALDVTDNEELLLHLANKLASGGHEESRSSAEGARLCHACSGPNPAMPRTLPCALSYPPRDAQVWSWRQGTRASDWPVCYRLGGAHMA